MPEAQAVTCVIIGNHMVITACKEPEWETRVVLTPAVAGKLVRLGAAVRVEARRAAGLRAVFAFDFFAAPLVLRRAAM